jgi:Tol biopolymer transport system component
MALGPGTRVGSYEIAESIGAGGMGEVYRASDRELKRDVAIKVLPQSFANDPERLARFQREAEMLAKLNHVNIAHIYGLEHADGTAALAMELVAGPTLAERIAEGPIPVDEVLGIARQITEALEAAHALGIVHRDLKPANIKLTPDGTVKVLDFGIAKSIERRTPSGPQAAEPTTPAMTETGVVLGTAAYMSPEQARGKLVDERADIWAFGCVLYEMLTGRMACGSDDPTGTVGSAPVRDAGLDALPSDVRQTINLCLQKDLKKRLADIRDVRLALEGAFATGVRGNSATLGRRARKAAFAAAVFATIAIAMSALWLLRETPPPALPETRLDIVTPRTDQPVSFALSPDGRQIVFVAFGERGPQLWLRSLATTIAQSLSGTEGARYPFWSPDGRSIGFFAEGALKRLDLGGGAPQSLAQINSGGRGAAWSRDGVIVFAPNPTSVLMRVPATGGPATAVTSLAQGQQSHRHPYMLPDGRRFLFYAQASPDAAGIYLGALDGNAATRLTPADGAAVYLRSGWLLWVTAGTLLAQQLDLTQPALTGDRVTLADGVEVDGFNRSAVSAAATGLVAYRTAEGSERQLTWLERSGAVRGRIGDPDPTLLDPRVSKDGRRVVVARTIQSNEDLWILDGARTSRFTFDAAVDQFPLWSPDGTRIVFRSTRTGSPDLYQKLASGGGAEERIVVSDQPKLPNSWSADGRFLLYSSLDPRTASDLWVASVAGEWASSVLLKTPFREAWAAFSPDGRWLAYHSDESGRDEIYVRPFIPPGEAGASVAAIGQWQVSTAGGTHATWRPDGQELYYLNPAGEMMSVPIRVIGDTLEPGAPVALFSARVFGGGVDAQQSRQYDVAADGHFLINMQLENADAPITLIQNWEPDAQR